MTGSMIGLIGVISATPIANGYKGGGWLSTHEIKVIVAIMAMHALKWVLQGYCLKILIGTCAV